jgi:hypothetical protein
MKKLFALVVAVGLGASFIGCGETKPAAKPSDKPADKAAPADVKEGVVTPMPTDPAPPAEGTTPPAEGTPAPAGEAPKAG